jgi:CPA1 family monovalent cation:H+ antiporter
LDENRGNAKPELAAVYEDLSQHYRVRLAGLNEAGDLSADGIGPDFYRKYVEVSLKLLKVERQTAVRLRNERHISDELLREIERELDLSESKLADKPSG